MGSRLAPERMQLAALNVGKHQILLMRDAQFAKAVTLREIGDCIHLFGGCFSWRRTGFLQRQRNRRIAADAMRVHVAPVPGGERLIVRQRFLEFGRVRCQCSVGRARKARSDSFNFRVDQCSWSVLDPGPLLFNFLAEVLDAACLDEDFDARTIEVVAASVAVVDPQYGFKIGEQVHPGQEFADLLADDRCAPKPAADDDAKADGAIFRAHCGQANVVYQRGSTVSRRATDCNLEFARQIGELGM